MALAILAWSLLGCLGGGTAAHAQWVWPDNFAQRRELTGVWAEDFVDVLLAASVEPGEPLPFRHTLWWTWTAPMNGYARLEVRSFGSGFSPQISAAVFTGTNLANLTLVARQSTERYELLPAWFPVSAGTSYQIQVGSDWAWFDDHIQLTLIAGPAVPNDDFKTSIPLGPGPAIGVSGDGLPTPDPGEPGAGIRGSSWWTWTAEAPGTVTVTISELLGTTEGSQYRTRPWERWLTIFRGDSLANLQEVPPTRALHIDSTPSHRQWQFPAEAGREYHLRVLGLAGPDNSYRLSIAPNLPPQIVLVSPTNGQALVTGAEHRLEAMAWDLDGPPPRVEFHGRSLGWQGTRIGTVDRPPYVLRTNLPTFNQEVYAIAIDALGAVARSELVYVEIHPPNDDFDHRQPIPPTNTHVAIDTRGATAEPGDVELFEVPDPHLGTAWWSWTPPTGGTYTATLTGFYAYLVVGRGTTRAELARLAPPAQSGDRGLAQVSFQAQAGVPVAIGASGASWDGLTLDIRASRPPAATWIAPAQSTEVILGTIVTLEVDVVDPDSSIERVDFYRQRPWPNPAERVARLTQPPYRVAATQEQQGSETWWVEAFDAQGNPGYSGRRDTVTVFPPPPNDSFATAVSIAGSSVEITGTAAGARPNTNVPPEQPARVWWSWTAPSNGTWTVTATNRDGALYRLEVYTGDDEQNLTLIAKTQFNSAESPFLSRVTFPATAGTRYHLAIGQSGDSQPFVFRLFPGAPPVVHLASAPGERRVFAGDAIALSATASDPDGDLLEVAFFRDGERLAVRTSPPFRYEFTATSAGINGAYYAIATDQTRLTTRSPELWLSQRPANDTLDRGIPLSGAPVSFRADFRGSLPDPGEPDGGPWIWWTWTAPGAGTYTIEASDWLGQRPEIGVFVGLTPESLARLPDVELQPGRAVFSTTAGMTYVIGMQGMGLSEVRILPGIAPAISWLGPTDNSTLELGTPVTATFTVVDEQPGTRVSVLLDGLPAVSGTEPATAVTQTFALPVTPASVGPHTLQIQATDVTGLSQLSAPRYLHITNGPVPNEFFGRRTPLFGSITSLVQRVAAGGLEPGEPTPPGFNSGLYATLWWTWTAPHSGLAHIRLQDGYGVLEAFTGPDLTHLTRVANSSAFWYQLDLQLAATAGTEYHLRWTAISRQDDTRLSVLQDLLIPAQISRPPVGPFQARYAATLPRTWRLDASTNLLTWEPLRWLVPFNDRLEWSDPDTTNHPRRFYRLEPDP